MWGPENVMAEGNIKCFFLGRKKAKNQGSKNLSEEHLEKQKIKTKKNEISQE